MRKPGDRRSRRCARASPSASCARPGRYVSSSGLATTPSKPAPSKRENQSAAVSRSSVAGVTWIGAVASREHRLEPRPPLAERLLAQRLVAEREQVERDVRRRDLDGELLDAGRGRMLAQLQRVEVEAASRSRRPARRRARRVRAAARAAVRAARGSSAAAACCSGSAGRGRRRRGTRCSGSRPTSVRTRPRRPAAARASASRASDRAADATATSSVLPLSSLSVATTRSSGISSRSPVRASLPFDDPVRDALGADDELHRHAEEIGVGELHARAAPRDRRTAPRRRASCSSS